MTSLLIANNFMIHDFLRIVIASMGMALFLFVPGYVLGWSLHIFAFRQRRELTRFLMAIALSVTIFPALNYLVARLTAIDLVLWIYGCTWAGFAGLVIRSKIKIRFPQDRWVRTAFWLTLAWVAAALLSLPDLQIGQRLYQNSISFDHQTRIALTDAIFRTGIPPVNPHIYPGTPLYVSYFYFWNIFPALLSRLTGGWIDARIAFLASAVWAGIALRAAACLYLRLQSAEGSRHIGPRCAAAVGLFFISGLDVIFASLFIRYHPGEPFITEWWNGNNQVTAWTGASLWVPHHIGGLVAGMTGILLFQSMGQEKTRGRKILLAALTALSLASVAGLSVYVAFIFAIFWGAYLVFSILHRAWRSRVGWILAVGGLAVFLAAPFIYDLYFNRVSFSAGGRFLVFEVRQLYLLSGFTEGWPALWVNLYHFALLPVNYFLELGFFLLAGLLYLQAVVKERGHLADRLGIDLLLLASSGLICSFFRSAIIGNNDIGWRGFMPLQFILLIWGAHVLVALWKKVFGERDLGFSLQTSALTRTTLAGLLVVGLASALFDLSYLRLFSPLDDRYGWSVKINGLPAHTIGARNYALRQAYRYIHQHYPITAIVQNNPEVESLLQTQGLYGLRQTVAAGEHYTFIYGDTPEMYREVSTPIRPLFADPGIAFGAIQETCRQEKIDVLIVKDLDPVWQAAESWVWQESPVFQNRFVRVFDCPGN